MRWWCGIASFLMALALGAGPLLGQYQPPSETMAVTAQRAWTWSEGPTNVIQLDGPLTIELDRATLSAQQAVIWLTPSRGAVLEQQQAEIALLGNAVLQQAGVKRSGPELYVTATVRGPVRVTADERLARNLRDSPTYQRALAIRPGAASGPGTGQRPWVPPAPPSPPSAGQAAPPAPVGVVAPPPVRISAPSIDTTRTRDGTIVAVISGGVVLFQQRPDGEFAELRAQNAAVFTTLTKLADAREADRFQRIEEAVTAVYLEGDVRINYAPPPRSGRGEQRLEANRAYYEFTTDRAVLTDAVIHATDPNLTVPVIIRAETIRQLSREGGTSEYRVDDVQLSTSAFATPSYSLRADKAYLRRVDPDGEEEGRTSFSASNTTLNLFGVPFFYLPWAGGTVTDRGLPIRSFGVENTNRFGLGVRSEWGLLETFGQPSPRDLDLTYRADYFSDRGPAGGLDAEYSGGFITETTRNPWNFTGDVTSYFVLDHGTDEFGGSRLDVEPPEDLRGRVRWEHQHFFPDNWQVQLRASWVSDANFLEEWFTRDWQSNRPYNESIYIKRQEDTEAFTFLSEWQPMGFVTTSDLVQEQFEVERLPELGYHRIGDSFANDRLTFFSDNTISRLHYRTSDVTLAEQGYPPGLSPGIPSLGQTGTTNDFVYRGDFRQEIDYPLDLERFKVVPYVLGRYLPYSDSPDDGGVQRVFAAGGIRATTAFWKVDNTARSGILDIHRLRHVIEPEAHLFASAQTLDRDDVFIYDEPVDAINDVQAAQVGLRQRWQTKRGGPGRWRSVDVFTFNVEGNFFANQPSEAALEPAGFRGLFFPSLPEASIPRNSVNADGLWRLSDTTVLLSDAQYNLDEQDLATASMGLAVQRDPRVGYFAGLRYIEPLDSNILSLVANYRLSTKYSFALSQGYDFGQNDSVYSSASVIRRFDRFFAVVTVSYDDIEGVSGVSLNISPEGVRNGFGTATAQGLFQ